jgi:regulatory protein YycH of two-component signal transduction system YycFG|tara:strand:- start:14818 stop:15006 length:189 start_codon:yes stop_codon:yes gene_type:complete
MISVDPLNNIMDVIDAMRGEVGNEMDDRLLQLEAVVTILAKRAGINSDDIDDIVKTYKVLRD